MRLGDLEHVGLDLLLEETGAADAEDELVLRGSRTPVAQAIEKTKATSATTLHASSPSRAVAAPPRLPYFSTWIETLAMPPSDAESHPTASARNSASRSRIDANLLLK